MHPGYGVFADLARFDRVGWQLAGGRVVVEGSVGDYAGGGMSAFADLLVRFSAHAEANEGERFVEVRHRLRCFRRSYRRSAGAIHL